MSEGAVKAAIQLREAQFRMCQAGHAPSCLAVGLVPTSATSAGGASSAPWLLIGGGVAAAAVVAWLYLR